MAQQHLDRLTATDASFLAQEHANSHMHVGGILLFEGPAPAFADVLDQIRSRLHLVPRYRQKLAVPPIEMGRPLWVDDPNFNLEYHIRHTALPPPGSEEQLLLTASRIFSQQLDRSRPLWETWLVERLDGNRFAMISKTHHSLVDGIAGVDLATVLFDAEPVPRPISHPEGEWQPQSEPGSTELVAAGLKGMVKAGIEVAARTVRAASRPETTVARGRVAAEGLGEVVWAGLNPAPSTPLNVEIGPHRRLVPVGFALEDFKEIKNAFGGTVNDVVLTVVAGAMRRWLRSRGVRLEGLELRAQVPVSIRTEGERGELGNRLAVMRAPLPVYVEDPLARLRVVKEAMGELKESKQAVGAEVLAGMQNFAPPTILAQASRLNFSTRLFNLVVTNVPGPQIPLYLLGRELLDIYPVGFLPENQALFVAIMSYNGRLSFTLLGDFDALPDIDVLADGVRESVEELLGPARQRAAEASDGGGGSKRSQGSRVKGSARTPA
jgi:diacylglycerol O-acyltransferase / wax synthase